MIERRYHLCNDVVQLQFFPSLAAFVEHARTHFMAKDEPWDVVFERSLGNRLAGAPLDDPQAVEVAEVYREIVEEHLHKGILFAQDRPVYIRLRQNRGMDKQLVFYFLACAGYVIIARHGQVRTAFFPDSTPRTSAYNRFSDAWLYLKRKAAQANYWDSRAGEHVQQTNVEWISPNNWQTCPNPHARKLDTCQEASHA